MTPRACASARAPAISLRRPDDFGRGRTRPRVNFVAERDPVDQLGDDEQIVVDLLERVDGADARMCQRRSRPRFAAQALAVHRIARQVRRQRFEGDLATETRVSREVHPSHAAAAELPDDRVGAEDRSGQQDRLVGQQIGDALDDRARVRKAPAR